MPQVWETDTDSVKARLNERLDGRSLTWLAEKTGDDYKNVQRWVSGTTAPPHDFLARFIRAIPTSGFWLLTGEGNPVPLPPTPAQEAVEAVRGVLGIAEADPASLGRVLATLAAIRRESGAGEGSPPPPE